MFQLEVWDGPQLESFAENLNKILNVWLELRWYMDGILGDGIQLGNFSINFNISISNMNRMRLCSAGNHTNSRVVPLR